MEKWTPEDEQRFQEQSRRREAAIKARELPVRRLVARHFGSGQESIFATLTKHADEFRDVLAPYDSGVRPAAPCIIPAPLTVSVPTCPPPMPEVLWQELPPHMPAWPDHLKPLPSQTFEVKLRNGHVIHDIGDARAMGWNQADDPSDIIAWRYV